MLQCWIKNCSLKIYRTDNCCEWHISQYQQQRHNQCSYKQGVKLYSTTAAGVLASLLLDLKKVNVKSSIFIIEFENLTFSYFWLLICWWYFSILQRLSKIVRYSVHNVNVKAFSFSINLLLGDNIFFMEYLPATASSRYPLEKLFRKFLKNSPVNTLEAWRKSFFNDVANSIPESLQKHSRN